MRLTIDSSSIENHYTLSSQQAKGLKAFFAIFEKELQDKVKQNFKENIKITNFG